MAFQSAVFIQQGFGVPGDLWMDYPRRALSYILESASAAYNIIGATCYTIASQGVAQAGSGGAYGFAGFLFNPKIYALQGTPSGGTLAPSLVLPNYTQAELMTEGSLVVSLPSGGANIGDLVIYNNTTGAITTTAPNVAPPGGYSFANAVVDQFVVGSGGGLAVIAIQPLLPTPA